MLTFKEMEMLKLEKIKVMSFVSGRIKYYQDRLHNLIDTDLGARDCNYSMNPSSVNDTVVI